jgi:hypothetical protein
MKTVATTPKLQSVTALFSVAKPSKKQKQISFGNALVSQMCTGRTELPERGSQTKQTGPRPADQVRIKVRAPVPDLRSGSKLAYDPAKTHTIRASDLIVSQPICP